VPTHFGDKGSWLQDGSRVLDGLRLKTTRRARRTRRSTSEEQENGHDREGELERRVEAVAVADGGPAGSASTISRINQGLDEELEKSARRGLEEAYPYLAGKLHLR
jgi:transposase-like protein